MVKIAAVQMSIEPLKPERNIERAFRLLEPVARQEPDFVCFPEFFITGPPSRAAIERFAQTVPGEYTEIFGRLASEHGFYVVMGAIIERDGNKYYDTSVLISPSGDVVGRYRKIFLWHPEKRFLERGWELPVFRTRFGVVGIQICWDLAFPEITRGLALKGADIVFSPAFWSEGDNPLYRDLGFSTERIFIDSAVASRAFENELAFVFVNGTGSWQLDGYTDTLSGHTQVALPFYGSVCKLHDEEKTLLCDIDLSILSKARKVYSIIEDVKKTWLKEKHMDIEPRTQIPKPQL